MCQCLLPFLLPNYIPLYRYNQFFIYLSVDRHLSCLHISTIWIKLLYHSCTSVFVCGPVFSLFMSEYLGAEFLDLMVVPSLTFWETARLFSLVSSPFYIPITNVWGFQFLYIFATLAIFSLFVCLNYSHSKECEVVHHCGFDVHFLSDEWHWAVFPVLTGRLYILFWEMSIEIICPFKNCVAVFLLLCCECFLCIIDASPLSDKSFANSFSHSVGDLFIFLIVSLEVWKYLIL